MGTMSGTVSVGGGGGGGSGGAETESGLPSSA